MIKSFEEVLKIARERGPKTVSVACAQDRDVLKAVDNARRQVASLIARVLAKPSAGCPMVVLEKSRVPVTLK